MSYEITNVRLRKTIDADVKMSKTQLIFDGHLCKPRGYFSFGTELPLSCLNKINLSFCRCHLKSSLVTANSLLIFLFPSRKDSALVTLRHFSAFTLGPRGFFFRSEAAIVSGHRDWDPGEREKKNSLSRPESRSRPRRSQSHLRLEKTLRRQG